MRGVAAFTVVAFLVCARGALAQTEAPSIADRETARALMDAGVAQRARGDVRGALASFRAADALMHVATTGLEVGRALADLGLLLEARDTLLRVARSEALPGEPRALTTARAEADALAAQLRDRIPSLRVVVAPAALDGARVLVDGRELPRELYGLARKVDPGAHVIVLERGGETARAETVVAEREQKDVEIGAGMRFARPAIADEATARRGAPVGAYVAFGVAGAAAIVGAVTGAMTVASVARLDAGCTEARCPPAMHDEVDRLHALALTGPTIVGSAAGAGLEIRDAAVSRLHAEITLRDDGVWLRHLGSLNGTYVDHVRVVEARIPDGARVRLGGVELEVLYEAAPRPVEPWPEARFGPLLGASAPMRELFAKLARMAAIDAPVLVGGETGTGKELVARALHDASPRAGGPFVVVDCAALAENLVESELFGHTRGAFTGAIAARVGALEAADGGTVFLDEAGELPASMQPRLLRALESRTIRRVGETLHRPINVRFVSATHGDLRAMVNVGAFREDLFFRLAVLPIGVPPLRDRRGDIPLLLEHLLARYGGGAIGPEALAEVTRRPWLGNVRELRSFVDRMRALGSAAALSLDAPLASAPPSAHGSPEASAEPTPIAIAPAPDALDYEQGFKAFREELVELGEREYVRRLLLRHGRQVTPAAKEACVAKTYLYRLIRRYGL